MSLELNQKKQPKKKTPFNIPKAGYRIPNHLLHKLNAPINIFDYRQQKIVFANERFAELVGVSVQECYEQVLDGFSSWIHPADLAMLQDEIAKKLLNICQTYVVDNTVQLTYTVNFRLRKQTGEFPNQVLAHCTILEWNEQNLPALALNILTDISNHKHDTKMLFAACIFNEAANKWEYVADEKFVHLPEVLTLRENEIMLLMAHGKTLKEINESLNISYYTVRTHCRNILEKINCKSQEDLRVLANKNGWI